MVEVCIITNLRSKSIQYIVYFLSRKRTLDMIQGFGSQVQNVSDN